MTINQAIGRLDALKPNSYSFGDKVMWLSELDGTIKTEIIDTHEGWEDCLFEWYDDERTDPETELLAEAPYDRMYITWLQARIDYTNGEYQKYNNANAMFEAEYAAFQNHYNRTHMPLAERFRYY